MMYELPGEERPQPSARLLDQWVRDAEHLTGGVSKRIGWMLASSVVIAALQRAFDSDQQPLFLVKGGLYLELRLGLKARATKDVDTLFRGGAAELERAVDAILADPWEPFMFERTEFERIVNAPRLVKPYRFDVKLIVRGKTWRSIRVEVSFPEGRIGSMSEPVPAPPVEFFGVKSPDEIVGIAMDYQIAQKSHAATDPNIPPDMVNDRVRDVIDLVLIKENLYADNPTPATLRDACVDVFNARAEEAKALGVTPRFWPPTFVANAAWERAYPALAESVGMDYTLEEAITIAQSWIDAIEHYYRPPRQRRSGQSYSL
ncbi:MAG: nucleotidyl transferase AbiEii/AbiGii toxin family protein [Propionibacteriaceae bacterium]|jgi:hypothetical protein|nr:nucleotidyl transferase AbiEii/AbiGii toxin family protein [Propionibacteriaceae bacterium]